MRIFSKRLLFRISCLLLIVLVSAWSASAQDDQDDQKSATSFIDSMAQTVYNLAWPSATYREVSIDGIEPADGGFDVLVRLSGQSYFDNSDLWLTLAFMFRNGKFYDIRVRDNNAILVPPFATTKALAKAAASLAKAYDDDQKAKAAANANPPPPAYAPPATPSYTPPPADNPGNPAVVPPAEGPAAPPDDPNSPSAEGACLHNPTNRELSFDYRWGENGQWTQVKLEPNEDEQIWWKYKEGGRPSPQLTVRYTDDSDPAAGMHIYDLDREPTTEPPSCESLMNYKFGMDGANLVVYTGAP